MSGPSKPAAAAPPRPWFAAGPLHLAVIVGFDVLCMALLVWLSA